MTYLIILFVIKWDFNIVKSLEKKVNVPEWLQVDNDL